MQLNTQKPKAKPIPLSEQRAKDKEAKKAKQIHRALKPKTLSHAQIAQAQRNQGRISKMQILAREHMLDIPQKRTYVSQADNNATYRDNLAAWRELVYCRNCTVHRQQFEKLYRNLSIAMAIIDADTYFNDVLPQAAHALDRERFTRDQSPNQRRALLEPLAQMCEMATAFVSALLPEDTLFEIGRYGTGVAIRHAYLQFMEMPEHVIYATIRSIRGENWHKVAKDYPDNPHDLRIKVLNAALCIYKIAECDSESIGIEIPTKITDLRSEVWQKWGSLHTIVRAAKYAQASITQPFENKTGLSLTADFAVRERAISHKIFN